MKAYRITSTEYHANLPHVFLFVDGDYYGELSYPRLRNYPTSIDYWRTATCADSDRYFHVEEVEVTGELIDRLKQLHQTVEENKAQLKECPKWRVFKTKKEREEDAAYNIAVMNHNKPYEKAIFEALEFIRNLIVEL